MKSVYVYMWLLDQQMKVLVTDFNSDLTNFHPLQAVVTTWLFDDENQISL